MKHRVILVRHAHAEWPNYQGRDFDRPLTAKGMEDARAAGRAMREAGHRPDHLLVSPALRTQQTASLIATELALPADAISLVDSLYNGAGVQLATELRRTAQATRGCVMLVGHNPGISELGRSLATGDAAPFAPADWRVAELPD